MRVDNVHIRMKTLGLVVSLLFLFGCDSLKLPIQMARVSQVEFYRQYFFDEGSLAEVQDDDQRRRQAQQVFRDLIGNTAFNALVKYVDNDLELWRAIKAGEIYTEGSLYIVAYLSLTDDRKNLAFFEGFGRYAVIDGRDPLNPRSLMSSDFTTLSDSIVIRSDMDVVSVNLKQRLYRHFDLLSSIDLKDEERAKTIVKTDSIHHEIAVHNYIQSRNNLDISFEVKLEKVGKDQFRLDYDALHPVKYQDGKVIGHLQFQTHSLSQDKLLDFRWRGSRIRKY